MRRNCAAAYLLGARKSVIAVSLLADLAPGAKVGWSDFYANGVELIGHGNLIEKCAEQLPSIWWCGCLTGSRVIRAREEIVLRSLSVEI